jgi:futalosine hydrolase
MRHKNLRKNNYIGLISSIHSEGKYFTSKLKHIKRDIDNKPFIYYGKTLGKYIVYSASGIGKTNTSHAATLLIHNFSPALIINFGVGGAYHSAGLKVGDIAVATKEIYAEEGVLLKNGLHNLETIGIPLLKNRRHTYFNEFPLDKKLGKTALNAAGLITGSKSGTFTTVSSCTGTKTKAKEISMKYNAICENMEGAAIAHLCCLYRIPCVEMRGISNIVENRDTKKWDIRRASENCQLAVTEFLKVLEGY